jgi:hypothetical protein
MSAKAQKTRSQPKKPGGFTAVSSGYKSLTTRLGALGDLKGPKQVREWLFLSLSETGLEIGKYVGRPFDKAIISLWERGKRPIPPKIVSAYCDLIASRLTNLLGRQVEVSIEVNSPWKVIAYARCACGQFFRMHDSNSRNCPRCRR